MIKPPLHSDMPSYPNKVFKCFSPIQDPIKGQEPRLVFSIGRTVPQPLLLLLFFCFFLFFSLFSFLKGLPHLFCRTSLCIFASIWLDVHDQGQVNVSVRGVPSCVPLSVMCEGCAVQLVPLLLMLSRLKWMSARFLHILPPNYLLAHILSFIGDSTHVK